MDQLSWEISSSSHDPEWDSYLEQSPYGHHEQTSRWGQVKARYGWQPLRLKATRNGERVAGVQVLLRPLGRWGRIGYICKGPVFDLHDSRLLHQVTGYLHAWAARQRLLYLVVELPYAGHAMASKLDSMGYRIHPEELPPSGLMSATAVMDISRDVDTLLAAMNRTKRRSVRSALKSGLSFREGTFQDVATFRKLMLHSCQRRGTAPTPPEPDFFENLWHAFEGTGWVKVFLVEWEGQPVHALLTFQFGKWVRAWKMGWSGEQDDKNPDEFDFWNVILWAKEHGFHRFDFVWLERDVALRVGRGERPSAAWQPDGMSYAKLGWGGEAVVLPQPRSRFYHPVLRLLSHLGAYRLIQSGPIKRLASHWYRGQRGEA